MFRLLVAGCALALVAFSAGAEDKKEDPKAVTTWLREVNGIDLKFEFGKDTATFNVTSGDNGVVVKAKLTKEKDVLTAEFTDVEEKGTFPSKPKKGDKISFKWVAKDGTATLSELKGADDAKDVLEGEYKLKK
ncbi:hypothetical protein J8F10_30670 [Gemmata sp. G18]|uniref:TIGR03067 domain-containing protein n=1 Tax=Gemmata palustris TaxID=2822762 RepID=A0ABS5C0Y1_9BACT|nr:hypothetical protein [Gemmata palustris]MBP3959631.1 hypothetical protein [Gemmata palustris]